MNKVYKVELDINNKTATYFMGCCGLARFAYNWALDYWIKEHERGEKRTGWMDIGKVFVQKKQTEFTWVYDYSKWIHVYAMKNCDHAYQNFFRRVRQGVKPGFPKFKSRKRCNNSFAINGDDIKITETKIKLPKIGWIRLKEHGYIPVNKRVCFVTITEKNGRWYVSVTTEEEDRTYVKPTNVIGVDLGIKTLAVTSEGTYYENPKTLYKAEKKLKRMDRWLSRKKEGSSNRKKAKIAYAKVHQKVARIRKHMLNEITTELAKTKSVIVVEDLNVSGMMKNHHLAKAIGDASFYEFRRMLKYKCPWYGSELAVIDRWFPSSKTCSNCGAINNDLTLNDRIYKCDCGLKIDRDLNAAINIRAEHVRNNARGDECKTNRSLLAASMKREGGSFEDELEDKSAVPLVRIPCAKTGLQGS